ncbi:Protein of unknown function [Pyronema omphalodes CBS 100304]|uniref:Uncharacterized protein n=1 Tax=Pyronema omphalodes (strain CBS 100304) TaxID=1076935 RepID=U4LIR2_PYROM|nr:Protein of unknown function [Pyronema omphalodes CBS 100304]
MSNSNSDSGQKLSPHFRDLRASNPEAIINAYKAANPGPLTAAISTALSALSHIDIRVMIRKIIDTITDADFRKQFLEAIKVWIETHPWHTGFLIVGIVLLANPLAIAGFGALGPVAGSIAAAWHSAIGGSVAAGSAFAMLQSMGMLGAVIIPAVGAGVVGATAVAVIAENEGIRNTMAGAGHAAGEVGRWASGEYGTPVENWWKGDYGSPVENWWKGDYGSPVGDWWGGLWQ